MRIDTTLNFLLILFFAGLSSSIAGGVMLGMCWLLGALALPADASGNGFSVALKCGLLCALALPAADTLFSLLTKNNFDMKDYYPVFFYPFVAIFGVLLGYAFGMLEVFLHKDWNAWLLAAPAAALAFALSKATEDQHSLIIKKLTSLL